MTVDEIIADLKPTSTAPAAVLPAGVAHADELAAAVYPIADKFCDGVYLLPADTGFLFNGLHVLTAARHPSVQPRAEVCSRPGHGRNARGYFGNGPDVCRLLACPKFGFSATRTAAFHQGRLQRTVPLRFRHEIQEMLRCGRTAAGAMIGST